MIEIEEEDDDQFLSLIEKAEAEAIASARTVKRSKPSTPTIGDESSRRDNQEEGSYMAALRGSRSSLWKLHEQKLNIHNKGDAVDRTDKPMETKPCPCGLGTCLVLTSNTAKNPGRRFYRCPLKVENGGCNFFEWCDSSSTVYSSVKTSEAQSNAQVPVLLCPCGAGSCLVLVSKSGKNEGQQFYKCPANGEKSSCGFFKWCNEPGSVSRHPSFSSQLFQASNYNNSNSLLSADKCKSSCLKCGQEGHWAKDCDNQSNSFLNGGKNQNGSCFKCGEAGHWARDCPTQNSNATFSGAKRCFDSSQRSYSHGSKK